MTFDLESISKSKRAFRRRLAQAPIVEKLQMLDALRQRLLSLRRARSTLLIREESARYRV